MNNRNTAPHVVLWLRGGLPGQETGERTKPARSDIRLPHREVPLSGEAVYVDYDELLPSYDSCPFVGEEGLKMKPVSRI